jgi:hypothetical protein
MRGKYSFFQVRSITHGHYPNIDQDKIDQDKIPDQKKITALVSFL